MNNSFCDHVYRQFCSTFEPSQDLFGATSMQIWISDARAWFNIIKFTAFKKYENATFGSWYFPLPFTYSHARLRQAWPTFKSQPFSKYFAAVPLFCFIPFPYSYKKPALLHALPSLRAQPLSKRLNDVLMLLLRHFHIHTWNLGCNMP